MKWKGDWRNEDGKEGATAFFFKRMGKVEERSLRWERVLALAFSTGSLNLLKFSVCLSLRMSFSVFTCNS